MTTQIRQQNGITILEPYGRLVGSAVIELRKVIAPEIEVSDAPRILINLKHVDKIDSAGLGALVEAHALTTRKEGRIAIIHLGTHIKNLIVLSRLVSLFERFDSEDAALSALAA